MSTLLVEIVPLALGAAISPVIFLLQLTTLTGHDRLHADRPGRPALIVVSTIGVLVGDTGLLVSVADNSVLAHRLCNRLDYSMAIGRSHARDLERIRGAREAAAGSGCVEQHHLNAADLAPSQPGRERRDGVFIPQTLNCGLLPRRDQVLIAPAGVANADNEAWSLYGAQRSQLVATIRKWEGAENGSDTRKPLPWVRPVAGGVPW